MNNTNIETKDLTNVKNVELHDKIISYVNNIGGSFGIEEVASKLKISVESVQEDIDKGTLIALDINGETKIPAFQIHSFKKLEGLEEILLSLKNLNNQEKLLFLNEPAKYLKNKTPAYVLRKQKSVKEIEKIKKAASMEKEAHRFLKEGQPSGIIGLEAWEVSTAENEKLPIPVTSRIVLN